MNIYIKLGLATCGLCMVQSLASADEPSIKEWAYRRVQDGLLSPLVEKENERSKFSRVRQVSRERRLLIVTSALSNDTKGRGFVRFETEARFGDDWQSELSGCVYRQSGSIFVRRGDEYRPAAYLLGKNVPAVPGVCEVAPSRDRS